MSSLTSVELNFLVFRYLQESGKSPFLSLLALTDFVLFFLVLLFEFVFVPVAISWVLDLVSNCEYRCVLSTNLEHF